MSGTFVYPSRAGPNDIRLLIPIAISHTSLHFTLIQVPRTAAPPYTAISYTWSDGEASEVIHLNDQEFHVRPNLWSCLHYIGHDTRRLGKVLWVDAVCIDQGNTAERYLRPLAFRVPLHSTHPNFQVLPPSTAVTDSSHNVASEAPGSPVLPGHRYPANTNVAYPGILPREGACSSAMKCTCSSKEGKSSVGLLCEGVYGLADYGRVDKGLNVCYIYGPGSEKKAIS
ncbi:hypothetical protein B0T24DRAFT_291782 [Lasiosphaeria ovina]|uniref:Heterokaryon incompatibility domain-containing protein n=1 Tax=Lasiosphaeria ovina TaxID=92902 RepID=A0AAE0KE70_9PEZI|nr:hypothetical protein B0T24DRAFT_291782 [Lasiosphaeria ovina]